MLVRFPAQPACARRDGRDTLSAQPKTYEWVLEGDITACFDEISHSALMDRVRRESQTSAVLALVKAFLKAGILTEIGDREGKRHRHPARWDHDSSNAVGNFCFEVSLSYRRVELPRRVSAVV